MDAGLLVNSADECDFASKKLAYFKALVSVLIAVVEGNVIASVVLQEIGYCEYFGLSLSVAPISIASILLSNGLSLVLCQCVYSIVFSIFITSAISAKSISFGDLFRKWPPFVLLVLSLNFLLSDRFGELMASSQKDFVVLADEVDGREWVCVHRSGESMVFAMLDRSSSTLKREFKTVNASSVSPMRVERFSSLRVAKP